MCCDIKIAKFRSYDCLVICLLIQVKIETQNMATHDQCFPENIQNFQYR